MEEPKKTIHVKDSKSASEQKTPQGGKYHKYIFKKTRPNRFSAAKNNRRDQ
jgi:hypothetical protein